MGGTAVSPQSHTTSCLFPSTFGPGCSNGMICPSSVAIWVTPVAFALSSNDSGSLLCPRTLNPSSLPVQFVPEGRPLQWPPAGLLNPLPIPRQPWSHIAVDFVTGLPPSAGQTTILTMVDHFFKAVHFILLPKLPSTAETEGLLVKHVFCLHGLPRDSI